MIITAERVREMLTYDPKTGLFRWRKKPGGWAVRVGDVAGSRDNKRGYINLMIDGRTYLAHRVAWLYMTGEWPVQFVDHRNLNKSDNRWRNLRAATPSQNSANRRGQKNKKGRHALKGVYLEMCWRARIRIGSKTINLGSFKTKEAAAAAYAAAARKQHGEFAYTE